MLHVHQSALFFRLNDEDTWCSSSSESNISSDDEIDDPTFQDTLCSSSSESDDEIEDPTSFVDNER